MTTAAVPTVKDSSIGYGSYYRILQDERGMIEEPIRAMKTKASHPLQFTVEFGPASTVFVLLRTVEREMRGDKKHARSNYMKLVGKGALASLRSFEETADKGKRP